MPFLPEQQDKVILALKLLKPAAPPSLPLHEMPTPDRQDHPLPHISPQLSSSLGQGLSILQRLILFLFLALAPLICHQTAIFSCYHSSLYMSQDKND